MDDAAGISLCSESVWYGMLPSCLLDSTLMVARHVKMLSENVGKCQKMSENVGKCRKYNPTF
jgi:hypothetical protein